MINQNPAHKAIQPLDLLDAAPDTLFETHVRIAATVCEAPIALLSLVDEHRLWFKSNVGLPASIGATVREHFFRAVAAGCHEFAEIPDLLADERLAAHPLLQLGLGLRYYAGMPVKLENGLRLGTLSIVDHRPRRLEAAQRQVLGDLAAAVVQTLLLHGRARTLAEAEHRLRHVHQETEQQHRLLQERSEMLDVLAHEVRQPLNNASAALQSAAAALLASGEQVASTRVARAQAVMMRVMASIDNTLAAGALLAGTESIARQHTDLSMLVRLTCGDLMPADRGRVQVEVTSGSGHAGIDPGLMRLALRNLLSNALKFSPAGSPVRVIISDADDGHHVCIDVADQGPGLEAELLPRLFERGGRGRLRTGEQGHGLGLYIVHRTMVLHHGSVHLVCNGPRGATFRLMIPLVEDERDDQTAFSGARNT